MTLLPETKPNTAAVHVPDIDDADLPPTPANSIFVANLPSKLSNHELAWSLYQSFRGFGALRLVRASRDVQGRPFGFVDFVREADGEAALQSTNNGNVMLIGERAARVEKARFQARLIAIPVNHQLSDLIGPFLPCSLKHHTDRSILQFDDRKSAILVYSLIKKTFPDCILHWLLPGHHSVGQQAVVRSSGLVQLAPEGSDLFRSRMMMMDPRPHHLYTFEEEMFTAYADNQHDVYVGRLCSWRVSRDLLRERFSQYGDITFIRLFNRGVIRPDSPVDAFAHIGFSSKSSQANAIGGEDGECWLGQVITVQALIPSKASKVQAAAKALCSYHDVSVENTDDFEIIDH